MKIYKIQKFCEDKSTNETVGLFKRAFWKGKGNGMGWYGAEYYYFAKLIASSVKTMDNSSKWDFTKKKKSYKKIRISSIMNEVKIEADSDEKAILKFQLFLQHHHDY